MKARVSVQKRRRAYYNAVIKKEELAKKEVVREPVKESAPKQEKKEVVREPVEAKKPAKKKAKGDK